MTKKQARVLIESLKEISTKASKACDMASRANNKEVVEHYRSMFYNSERLLARLECEANIAELKLID